MFALTQLLPELLDLTDELYELGNFRNVFFDRFRLGYLGMLVFEQLLDFLILQVEHRVS